MESIPKDTIFEFNDDTLQYLRKQYNLDKPGRIEEAINSLEEWIKKQRHFVKKEYPRDYLERTIIINKGSVERAKKKLDKICSSRTLFPDFFGVHNINDYEVLDDLYGAFLPKLTEDHYRVYLLKNKAKRFNSGFMDFYRYFFMAADIPVSCVTLTEAVMDSISTNRILEFNTDTLQYLRTLHGLEKPGRLEEAISILIEWLKKQDHLIKKDFSPEYLERIIIFSKGSVERAKLKHDKTCTFKTLLPDYFEPFDVKNSNILKILMNGLLPKLTNDHYRVFVHKNVGQRFEHSFFEFYKYLIMICEYLQAHDYCNGVVGILDYFECNVSEMIKNINLVELRNVMSIIMEGYGMRIKGVHFLTTSKAIDVFIAIFKQAVSEKVAQRIHVHKNAESLHEHLQKDILPADYGGNDKSIKEISGDLMDALSSEEYIKYFNVMKQARTNEAHRSQESFNDQYMGVAGSFRKLSVD